MADLAKIADELSTLTVIEASELSKMLEEKWGVSAAAPVAIAAAPGAAPAAERREQRVYRGLDTSAEKINVDKRSRDHSLVRRPRRWSRGTQAVKEDVPRKTGKIKTVEAAGATSSNSEIGLCRGAGHVQGTPDPAGRARRAVRVARHGRRRCRRAACKDNHGPPGARPAEPRVEG